MEIALKQFGMGKTIINFKKKYLLLILLEFLLTACGLMGGGSEAGNPPVDVPIYYNVSVGIVDTICDRLDECGFDLDSNGCKVVIMNSTGFNLQFGIPLDFHPSFGSQIGEGSDIFTIEKLILSEKKLFLFADAEKGILCEEDIEAISCDSPVIDTMYNSEFNRIKNLGQFLDLAPEHCPYVFEPHPYNLRAYQPDYDDELDSSGSNQI